MVQTTKWNSTNISDTRLNEQTLFWGTVAADSSLQLPANSFYLRTTTNILYQNTGTEASPTWTVRLTQLTESTEQNTTPVADDAQVLDINTRDYAFFTLPTTEKFYIMTGIEWKNGTSIAGNVMCGVDIVDANPPTLAQTTLVAWGREIAQSGASSVQRNSAISSLPIRGGTICGAWTSTNNASTGLRRLTGQASANYRKSITYTVAPPTQDATAWTAITAYNYIKVYYRGYS